MKRFSIIVIFLEMIISCYSCRQRSAPQKKEEISQQVYQNILSICPKGVHKVILIYYFDGDCAICLGKASYIEKYANARGLTPVLIAQTLNSADFQYNIKKMNIQACVHIDVRREFVNKINFMKVTRVDTNRKAENYDKVIEK